MQEIFKHGNRFRRFKCFNCECEFGTTECTVAIKKGSTEFDHASARCPECQGICTITKKENEA